MKTEIKQLENCQVEIKGEMDWQELEKYFNQALDNLSSNIVLDGFRPGKAPKDILLKKLGDEKVLLEAGNLALRVEYPKIVKENNLEPINHPQVSITKLAKNNPFEFKIQAEVLPEIVLPNLEQITKSVEKKEVQVEQKDVENALLFLQKSRADFEDLDKPAQKGDFVLIKYQSPSLENNKEFSDKFILGEGQLVKGFEDNLIGMQAGEDKSFESAFPADFLNKAVAGKTIKFNVKMEKVQKMVLSQLNDEFAKKLGKFETLEKLKQSIKEGVKTDKENEQKQIWRKQVLDEIKQKVNITLPKTLVALEKERLLKQFKQSQAKGEDVEKMAVDGIKNYLILNQIAKEKNIEVSEKEIAETVEHVLSSYPQNADGGKNQVDPEKLKSYYKEKLLEEKALKSLEEL